MEVFKKKIGSNVAGSDEIFLANFATEIMGFDIEMLGANGNKMTGSWFERS